MKIKKILNNNAVVVMDKGEEKIVIGAGIAYQKQKNDVINQSKIEKIFVMKENEKFQKLLLKIPEEHLALSEDIIAYAEEYLGSKLNDHIHIALTDHLSFAIERIKDGIELQNKLFNEIKILYKKEFEIGLWALRHIEKEINLKLSIDEAAYIALHIHTAKLQNGDIKQTLRQTAIVSNMVETIKDYLKIQIEEDDISYQRLITHLRFAITRVGESDTNIMDEEILLMLKKKFSTSYHCAKEVSEALSQTYGIYLPEQELGYITLHIERLRQR